jgi:hypothetical protein
MDNASDSTWYTKRRIMKLRATYKANGEDQPITVLIINTHMKPSGEILAVFYDGESLKSAAIEFFSDFVLMPEIEAYPNPPMIGWPTSDPYQWRRGIR